MVKITKEQIKDFEVLNISDDYYIDINLGIIVAKKSLKIIGSINKQSGYKQCSLSCLNKTFYIHHLIYLHANNITHYNTKINEIDHIDRDKLNNCINNLRMVTISENRKNRVFKIKESTEKKNKKQIVAHNLDNNFVKFYYNIKDIVNELNISQPIISMILNKKKYYKSSYSDVHDSKFSFKYIV